MQNWVRHGILALPFSGLLATLSSLVPGAWTDPSVDPGGFARASANIALANMIGIPVAILLPIGTLALYSFTTGTAADRWALGALLLLFAGLGLFMPFAGIFAFAAPVLGRDYLNGDMNAINVITESTRVSNPSALVFGATGVFLLVISSIMVAAAIWESHRLPRWAGILYPIGMLLSVDPLYIYQPIVAILGGLLLLVSSGWIAVGVLKHHPEQRRIVST
jgi:hypothetical protein